MFEQGLIATMKHVKTTSFLARLTVVPAVVGLISASFILGYASNDLWPNRAQIAHGAAYRINQQDTQGVVLTAQDDKESRDAAQTSDPVADYRAAMALIQQKYYGAKPNAR